MYKRINNRIMYIIIKKNYCLQYELVKVFYEKNCILASTKRLTLNKKNSDLEIISY